ncbi:MAG TPA: potassium channel family protein [Methyloceanibacter sp.]|nr:potassium channel family protein [Methyloceanibacter sp.]
MVDQILAGGATSLVNLVIHALVMGVLIKLLLKLSDRATGASPFLAYPVIIVATGSVLFAAHFAEVLLWAYTYAAVGAAPPGTDLVYFAFGNYTTLGYGDVLPLEHWRVLAPMTALNGIMLIGWSTALIFAILRRAVPNIEKR